MRRTWPSATDLAVAGGMGALALADVVASPGAPTAMGLALATLPALAVLLRRRLPVTVNVTAFTAITVAALAGVAVTDAVSVFLLLPLLPFAAGAHTERGPWVLAAPLAAIVAINVMEDMVALGDFLFPGAFAIGGWAAGRAVRTRTALAAELHEAAVQEADEHAAAVERAAAEERRRIARELHDVVAHSVSVMVVQAGGARWILDRDVGRAEHAIAEIERTGREALAEMRRLLGVLDGGAGAARAPAPGLGQLDALLRRARGAGLDVTLAVEGERRDLPPGLDLTAYRVVQEGLTNAIKHAGAAHADVLLRFGDDELEVAVRDPGGAGGPRALEGAGHGLGGLEERARMLRGQLASGPRPDGGFELRARLPYDPDGVAVA